jgi:hypothetical protein
VVSNPFRGLDPVPATRLMFILKVKVVPPAGKRFHQTNLQRSAEGSPRRNENTHVRSALSSTSNTRSRGRRRTPKAKADLESERQWRAIREARVREEARISAENPIAQKMAEGERIRRGVSDRAAARPHHRDRPPRVQTLTPDHEGSARPGKRFEFPTPRR